MQVQAQFIAEITVASVLQLSDLGGHFKRHFLAPRARTQDAMNLQMQGSSYEVCVLMNISQLKSSANLARPLTLLFTLFSSLRNDTLQRQNYCF